MSQKIHAGWNNHFAWLDLLLLALLTAYILSGITLVPFHGDESTFILMSEDYDRIVEGDFKRILFKPEGIPKQYIRLSTGSILALSIGFARDITNAEGPTNKWLWGSSWEQNVKQGNMPDPQLLSLARTSTALMGALSIVVFFMTARRLFPSRLAAWAATLVLATHGDVLMSFRRVIQEGPKFLFLILTLYVASRVLGDLQNMKMRRYLYVLLGIASGLTLAAKQDTAPMLIAAYLALALVPVWKRETIQAILINVLYLGTATILAFACFLAFMPVFWGWWENVFVLTGLVIILFQLPVWKTGVMARPLALTGCALIIAMTIISPTLWHKFPTPLVSMAETRDAIIGGQVKLYRGDNFVTARDRMVFLLKATVTSNVMYMEAPSFDVPPVHGQIKAYEDSFVSGRTGSLVADGFVAVLAVIGGWSLLRQFNAESLLIYSLLITSAVLLFAMVPLPWQRYYLIMQIPYSLVAGVGAGHLWTWGKQFFERSSRHSI